MWRKLDIQLSTHLRRWYTTFDTCGGDIQVSTHVWRWYPSVDTCVAMIFTCRHICGGDIQLSTHFWRWYPTFDTSVAVVSNLRHICMLWDGRPSGRGGSQAPPGTPPGTPPWIFFLTTFPWTDRTHTQGFWCTHGLRKTPKGIVHRSTGRFSNLHIFWKITQFWDQNPTTRCRGVPPPTLFRVIFLKSSNPFQTVRDHSKWCLNTIWGGLGPFGVFCCTFWEIRFWLHDFAQNS